MENQDWTEAEYLAHLADERRMFAWVLHYYGSLSATDARDAALAFYPYEEPGDLRGLIFHDEAWHWAMLRIHGEGYWRTRAEFLHPSQEYRDAWLAQEPASGA
ncbi:hypothetical protein [Montanilutibacter psychrotolerans]|uniref:hypothetical protein n=1 Tax=Montanilutibacter psychrotolerans TaxID=1327343 RepID=UPI001CC1D83F|nr:hypothetical protein [Lysobacter psychrotolerans]